MTTPTTALKPAFPGSYWETPLMPVAWAWTLGIVVDRHFAVEPLFAAVLVAASLLAWSSLGASRSRLSLAILCLAIAAAGMLRHHVAVARIEPDDISRFLSEEPQP